MPLRWLSFLILLFLPKSLYDTIAPYLMSLVLYDPPYTSLGYELPGQDSVYDPWTDADYPTPEQLYDNFQHWPSGCHMKNAPKKRTYATWNEEQRAKYFDTVAAVRSELPAYAPPMRATLKAQTHQALFNTDLVSSYFPDVNIFYISGCGTCYYCMWAYMEVSRMYKEAILRGDKVRLITFKLVEEGNHFVVKGCKQS
ncbi:hypothetical protein B0H14DRAFT_3086217 [Mycena olivaceomarginata]|nr:hypothetical protein B0H14DRAFT_3086217 [Mycena olivaceomarginata]